MNNHIKIAKNLQKNKLLLDYLENIKEGVRSIKGNRLENLPILKLLFLPLLQLVFTALVSGF